MHGTIESGFRVELKRLDELAAFAPELRDLTARAVAPNAFYEPAFMAAAAPVFGRGVMAGLVWRRAMPRQLTGFFPVAIEQRRYGLRMPMLVGWTHSYGPLGAPLVDRDCADAAVAAWLDHIAADPTLPKLMLMPYLPAEGAVAQAFDAALAHRDGRSEHFALHRRALLAPTGDRAGYLDHAMPHKKRKELRRLRKRLAEIGTLTSTTIAKGPTALTAAVLDFLALEASGWKGRAGTAAKGNDAVHCFVVEAVSALAAEGKASVARLTLDNRAIAAIVTLRSGDEAWCWKIAYDEGFSRASPGVQLLLDVTDDLLADAGIARADSCATPSHPMIDHIWRERLALSDRLMCVAKCDPTLFAHLCRMESLRRSAIDKLKWLRGLLRRT
ncbi:MAG: GNAT family N-acetyltransferase [Xanthobacteraceae bacterium]|nr:GNAT family N-acetyltransferase [Xanthobacteraceae bacterium]